MNSAYAAIGNAVGYDLPESILASGGSLADAFRAAILVQDMTSEAPISVRIDQDARGDVATMRPVRA
jgi:hypothetical protein